MAGVPETIDIYGLPVGAGGVCVRRREAYLPGMLAIGVLTSSLPPLLIVVFVVLAAYAGINVFGDTVASTVAFAGVLAILLLTPFSLTRPLIKRWASFETRYEVSPEGLRRTSVRDTRAFVWKLPPDRSYRWTDISPDETGGPSGLEFSESAPYIPWFTRRIGFRDGSPPIVISGTSDWLNPGLPAMAPVGANEPWEQMKLEDFIGACISAFAAAYRA